MNTFEKLFRAVLVACVALIGMVMAAVLIVSTAVALAVVYVVARLRGKPVTASAFFNAIPKGAFGFRKAASHPVDTAAPRSAPTQFSRRPKRADIIDVEVRDLP